MSPTRGYYCLIQFCPDPSRLEAANIGVLLFCPDRDFLRTRTSSDDSRVRRFFGPTAYDQKRLNAFKSGLEDRLAKEGLRSLADLEGFIARSANRAVSKGIFVAASAGNEGNTPWQYLLTPGDPDSVLTIGAVDRQNLPFSGSSRGPNADGVIKPDVVAMGVSNAVFNASGNLEQATGTSFATPVIAGLAACLLQQDSTLTPFRLRQIIRASADHFHHPDNQVGYGLPDFGKALQELTGIARTATLTQDSHFIIAPNPIQQGTLQILFLQPPQQAFRATIRDMKGRTIIRQTFRPLSVRQLLFPLPPLTPGAYRLTIQTKQYRSSASFIQAQ